MKQNIDYRDFMLENTSREKENIEWTVSYTYNAQDKDSVRILLIGDSICNAYQVTVRELLKDCINVTFWATSKCVSDRDYLRELNFYLETQKYDMIFFNNGAHSSEEFPKEREKAYTNAVEFIRAKLPDIPLALVLCTPGRTESLTKRFKHFNDFTCKVAKERNLPVIDLFTLMESTDKNITMKDDYHWQDEAVKVQAEIIAHFALNSLEPKRSKIEQLATKTGPDGKIK